MQLEFDMVKICTKIVCVGKYKYGYDGRCFIMEGYELN
jgi:hypothetical protein